MGMGQVRRRESTISEGNGAGFDFIKHHRLRVTSTGCEPKPCNQSKVFSDEPQSQPTNTENGTEHEI